MRRSTAAAFINVLEAGAPSPTPPPLVSARKAVAAAAQTRYTPDR
jgi:hypothetical protein